MIMELQKPAWLDALYTENFFVGCNYHENSKKNEKNVCCLDCCTSLCPHCVPSHRYHRLLQVRRYVYHEVVRLEDLQKLIDCSNVQAYTINSAKVVFIKKRSQNRQFKGASNYCTSCDRSLQEPFIHCSLGCKVDYVLKHYKDLSQFLKKCTSLTLGPDYFVPQEYYYTRDEEMTNETTPHSTIVDSDEHEPMGWSSSPGSENTTGNYNNVSYMMAYENVVRKKRSGFYASRSPNNNYNNKVSHDDQDYMATSNLINRRKGIPQRSPFC